MNGLSIDGKKVVIYEVRSAGYGMEVSLEDGREFLIFESAAEAGRAARQYWEDLANGDPKEFACLVGTDTLVAWALGQYAGPGSTHVTSLDKWLDLFLDVPEEEWGRQDGTECGAFIDPNSEAAMEIGFVDDAVAYEQ